MIVAQEIQPIEWDLRLISILRQMPELERNRMLLAAEALVASDKEPTVEDVRILFEASKSFH